MVEEPQGEQIVAPAGVAVPIEDIVSIKRKDIKEVAKFVKGLMSHPYFKSERESGSKADIGEMKANIMLSYRHLEDAAMRLGKVLQAHDGGVSVYDK